LGLNIGGVYLQCHKNQWVPIGDNKFGMTELKRTKHAAREGEKSTGQEILPKRTSAKHKWGKNAKKKAADRLHLGLGKAGKAMGRPASKKEGQGWAWAIKMKYLSWGRGYG